MPGPSLIKAPWVKTYPVIYSFHLNGNVDTVIRKDTLKNLGTDHFYSLVYLLANPPATSKRMIS